MIKMIIQVIAIVWLAVFGNCLTKVCVYLASPGGTISNLSHQPEYKVLKFLLWMPVVLSVICLAIFIAQG